MQAQQGLLSLAPSALNTILPKEEDLSPAGVEAYNLVAALSDADFPQVGIQVPKYNSLQMLCCMLMCSPCRHCCHRSTLGFKYCALHLNFFNFD